MARWIVPTANHDSLEYQLPTVAAAVMLAVMLEYDAHARICRQKLDRDRSAGHWVGALAAGASISRIPFGLTAATAAIAVVSTTTESQKSQLGRGDRLRPLLARCRGISGGGRLIPIASVNWRRRRLLARVCANCSAEALIRSARHRRPATFVPAPRRRPRSEPVSE